MSDKCYHCGCYHEGVCPRVKAIEYSPNGAVKTEYHNPSDHLRQQLATTERLLAESQAREKVYVSALEVYSAKRMIGLHAAQILYQYPPSDSTALDAAIAKAKREENEACAQIAEGVNNFDNPMTAQDVADSIRARLADELKGGKQ